MPYKDPEIAKLKKREYYVKHRDTMIAASLKWEREHRAQVTERKRKVRHGMTQEERMEYNLKARLRYHADKEKQKLRKINYRAKNKSIVNANSSKRRAAKLLRTPKWITEFDLFKIKCMYQVAAMLTKINNEPWVIDHVIPLQGEKVSGLHVPSNLQFMRARENEAKRNKYEII